MANEENMKNENGVSENNANTTYVDVQRSDAPIEAIMTQVYAALKERGYNPMNQIVGYIMSGDPSYITSFKDARALITKVEVDEILDELVRSYLEKLDQKGE